MTCRTASRIGRPSRRALARWPVAPLLLVLALARVAVGAEPPPRVTVTETHGRYTVAARFTVPQRAEAVIAVLTDYEQIPEIMPDVRSSTILERGGDRAVVEQEAVARFLMFSRRVHLVLEVQEAGMTIRFRDRCGTSFRHYAGAWTLVEQARQTTITYELTAAPSFDVPEFLLKRLLKRDADRMIDLLKSAIARR
jgi:carbon monoxide dehydrogenase subunit G